jgi:hypothetical protein
MGLINGWITLDASAQSCGVSRALLSLTIYRLKKLVTILALLAATGGYAQNDPPSFPLDNFYVERRPWGRSFFKDFHFSLSTGYGNTFFRHTLPGFGVMQPKGYDSRIFSTASGARYTNWVNTVVADTLVGGSDSFFISSDTARLGFKGLGFNIPLKATLHYEFLGRYRIGGGYSYELMFIGHMRPITYKDQLSGFQPSSNAGFMKKYFGMAGFSFYRLGSFLFTGDVNVGGYKPGNNFTMGLIKKGVYANAGVTIEKEFSENLQVFARPSFEIKNYTLSVPGAGGAAIVHYFNAFYVNVGITWSLPALPKCFHKECQAQINHAHGDREYRSRMHKFHQKQNPMYGENFPKLFKYKRKNEKKMNPY